jgi:isoquinoline 1-oxidoreductase subunit alpha
MNMLTLTVNGVRHEIGADPSTPLLWVLREDLGLTGTKYGCGIGVCGACTVHLGGAAVRSCTVAIGNLGDAEITTIEGLSSDGTHPLQRAWCEHDVPQCGYCQAGQIMTAAAFLRSVPHPTLSQVREALAGNLCRCGTYHRIEAAILSASGIHPSPTAQP